MAFADGEIGHEEGVVGNVVGAHVQRPGYLREVVDHHQVGIRLMPAHGGEDLAQFAARTLAGYAVGHDAQRCGGQCRPSLPQCGEGVGIDGLHPDVGAQSVKGSRGHLGAHHLGREPHRAAVTRQMAVKPLGDCGHAVHSLAHQGDARAGELVLGLEEIARVGPERRTGQRDHGGTGRAREAREPFAAHPVGGRIFAVVGVGGGHDEGAEAGLVHPLAQMGQAQRYFGCCHDKKRFR